MFDLTLSSAVLFENNANFRNKNVITFKVI